MLTDNLIKYLPKMTYFTKSSKVVSFWGLCPRRLRSETPAKISGFAPALNSVQSNQIYFYPKIVGDYLSTYKFFDFKKVCFFLTQKIAQTTFWCNQ